MEVSLNLNNADVKDHNSPAVHLLLQLCDLLRPPAPTTAGPTAATAKSDIKTAAKEGKDDEPEADAATATAIGSLDDVVALAVYAYSLVGRRGFPAPEEKQFREAL